MNDDNFENININDTIESKEKESRSQSQSNSIILKSFDNNNFNYSEILDKKNDIIISFNNTEKIIETKMKSIKKIFSLISENNDIESLCSQYITALISNDSENLCFIDDSNDLDLSFMKLLEQTKFYTITFNNSKKNNTKNYKHNLCKNNTIIFSDSLNKIFKLLQRNVFSMYEYINIIILNKNDENKNYFSFKKKILEKFLLTDENFFKGVKFFEMNLEKPKKMKMGKFNQFDNLFNHVLDLIEKKEGGYFEAKKSQNLIHKDNESDIITDLDFNFPKNDVKDEMNNINRTNSITNNNPNCNCGSDVCTACNIY